MSRLDEMDAMMRQRQRSFRRTVRLIIAVQVAIVAALIWLLTHPEAIGGFAGRIVAGFIAQ